MHYMAEPDTSDAQKPVSCFDLRFQFCVTVTSAFQASLGQPALGRVQRETSDRAAPPCWSGFCLLVFLDPRKTLEKEQPWSSPLSDKAPK